MKTSSTGKRFEFIKHNSLQPIVIELKLLFFSNLCNCFLQFYFSIKRSLVAEILDITVISYFL